MAIDNFCEGKNMEEYEVLKKAAAELNEIMHAAHINASDRAVYASGMLLAMHVLTPGFSVRYRGYRQPLYIQASDGLLKRPAFPRDVSDDSKRVSGTDI